MHVYRVKWLDPVKVDLTGNLTVYSIPPPGSGVLTAYILNILDDLLPRDKAARKDPLTYHRIAEAFKHAFAYRTKLADPAFSPEVDEVIKFKCLLNFQIVDFFTFKVCFE